MITITRIRLFGPSDRRGFSLVEIMIAVLVLTIGMLGATALLLSIIDSNRFSDRLSTAVTLSRDRLEEVKRLGYNNADTAAGTEDYGSISNFSLYKRVTTVSSNTPAANMKTVNVTVYWDSDAHSVTLSTILAAY
jgi:type IV pilus modification protein PilV